MQNNLLAIVVLAAGDGNVEHRNELYLGLFVTASYFNVVD